MFEQTMFEQTILIVLTQVATVSQTCTVLLLLYIGYCICTLTVTDTLTQTLVLSTTGG